MYLKQKKGEKEKNLPLPSKKSHFRLWSLVQILIKTKVYIIRNDVVSLRFNIYSIFFVNIFGERSWFLAYMGHLIPPIKDKTDIF